MSVSYWWFGVFIDDSNFENVKTGFDKASTDANISEKANAALELWKKNPDDFTEEKELANIKAGLPHPPINDFMGAFYLNGFADFGESIVSKDNPYKINLSEESVARFIMANRNLPVAVLWHALGYDLARQLPGNKGNLLVHSTEIGNVLSKVNSIFQDLDEDKLVERGLTFCSRDLNEEDVLEIITMFPYCLERAAEEKKGILFLAMPQL